MNKTVSEKDLTYYEIINQVKRRPYLVRLEKLYVGKDLSNQSITGSISKQILKETVAQLTELAIEKTDEEFNFFIQAETWLAVRLLYWMQKGRPLFHLNKEIIELLTNTSASDIPYEHIQLPYSCFYISLRESQLRLYSFDNQDLMLDGVLVSRPKPYILDFFFFLRHPHQRDNKHFTNAQEHKNGFTLSFVNKETTIGEALKEFKNRLSERYKEDEVSERMTDVDQVLPLFLNAVLYLTTVPEDQVLELPNEIPLHLRQLETRVKSKKQRTEWEARLTKEGYGLINFVGRKLSLSQTGETNHPLEEGVKTHWRRGHFRLQPVGAGLKQKKKIWIKPVLVRADKGDADHAPLYKIENN